MEQWLVLTLHGSEVDVISITGFDIILYFLQHLNIPLKQSDLMNSYIIIILYYIYISF